MKIFLAGHYSSSDFPHNFSKYKAPYILQTFYDAQHWKPTMVHEALGTPKIFMLDSGAFSFFHIGKSVNWDQYLSEYINFINQWGIEYFFELDIDALVGADEVRRLTARLERETGKKSIPVFHKCRGLDWYRQACKDYNYIAISAAGLTKETNWTNSKSALRYLIKIAHDEGTKVHGLGYTRLENINNTTVPFDSVDSTSWSSGSRYATVYKFTGQTMKSRRITGHVKNGEAINEHNIQEWIKLSRYKAQGDNW